MNIEYLKWDSAFFQKKIGKIIWPNNNNITALITLLKQAKKDGYNLIYCFGDESFYLDKAILSEFHGTLVDRKIIFEGTCNQPFSDCSKVEEYKNIESNDSLEKLAYSSGRYSRFKLEPYFNENDFKKLYKIWLLNSLNKKIADKIFVIKENTNIKGLITIGITANAGVIGLLAVDETMKGKGYGTQLINAVKKYLREASISCIEVATQLNNIVACNFYKKNGFSKKSTTNIYHFSLINNL